MEQKKTSSFSNSKIGKILTDLTPASTEQTTKSTEENKETAVLSEEQLQSLMLEFRALVARIGVLPEVDPAGIHVNGIDPAISALLDSDLVDEVQLEMNPNLSEAREVQATRTKLQEILQHPEILNKYAEIYDLLHKEIRAAKTLSDIYKNRALKPKESVAVVRQLSRILHNLIRWCEEEEQNIHNQISRERRGYRKSDRDVLAKLKGYKEQCTNELNEIRSSDNEVIIQERMDEIKLDKQVLSRSLSKDAIARKKGQVGKNYLATPSRRKFLFGDDKSPAKSMLAVLRKRNNIELTGPTGTGKTKLAEYAALMFSGKEGIIVSGTSNTSIYTFLGSPSDLGKRNEGALITCLKEARVLILDEDNRFDTRVLAVLKYVMGLKPGDIFIHPDTGEKIIVPPGFGIIASRNEVGKHHKDRSVLPPEYRREFVHGSFEVGYFPKEEIYYNFLIPKLCNDDGSISLTEEEVGGNFADPRRRSPLVALVTAAEKIQDLYQKDKIMDGVFESGFLIDFFSDWHEQHARTGCTFLEYIEVRLKEFLKRPVGNAARKEIIKVLVEQGFFTYATEENFTTLNDGNPITNDELNNLRGAGATPNRPIFPVSVTGATLNQRAVALLDPFGLKTKNLSKKHPLDNKITEMKKLYQTLCDTIGQPPFPITGANFTSKRPQILKFITDYVDSTTVLTNKKSVNILLKDANMKSDEDFIEAISSVLQILVSKLNP